MRRSHFFLTTLLTFFSTFFIFIYALNDARAESNWVVHSGVNFQYFYLGDWTTDSPNFGQAVNYYGGVIDIQGEYRFTSWFGLGLDAEFGGLKSVAPNPFVNNNHFFFQSYITARFIAPLESVDLWGELGIGPGTMYGEYYTNEVSKGASWTLLARMRLGATFKLNDDYGVGIHVGVASGIPMPSAFVDAGLHISFYL